MLKKIGFIVLVAAVGFSALRYLAMKECAEFPPPSDQTGKIFIVTGGNNGLGFETTKALAGWFVYIIAIFL